MALPRWYTMEDLASQQAVDQHAIAASVTRQMNLRDVDLSEDESRRWFIYTQSLPVVLQNGTNLLLDNSFTTPFIPQFNTAFENHSPGLPSIPIGEAIVNGWPNSQLTRNGSSHATSFDFNTRDSIGWQSNYFGSLQQADLQDCSQTYDAIFPEGFQYRNQGVSLSYQAGLVPRSVGFEDSNQLDPSLPLLHDHPTAVLQLNENNEANFSSGSPPTLSTDILQLDTSENILHSNTNSRKRGAPSGSSTSAVTTVSKRRKGRPSCGWCSLHKARCESDPCDRCLRQCNKNALLAERICKPPLEFVWTIRKDIEDFFDLDSRRRFERPILRYFSPAQEQKVKLAFPPYNSGGKLYYPTGNCREFLIENCLNFEMLFYPGTSNESCTEDEDKFAYQFFVRHDLQGKIINKIEDGIAAQDPGCDLDEDCFPKHNTNIEQFAFFIWARANPNIGKTDNHPEYKGACKQLLTESFKIQDDDDNDLVNADPLNQLEMENGTQRTVKDLRMQFKVKTGWEWLRVFRQYQIAENSLPSVDYLVDWALNDLNETASIFPNDISTALDVFLQSYLSSITINPDVEQIRPIVLSTLKITALARYLDGRRPIENDRFQHCMAESGENENMSKKLGAMTMPMRNQLFRIAVMGIERTEAKLLDDIDKAVYNKKTGRLYIQRSPIVLGLCLRRLTLYYRRIMMRYLGFGKELKPRYKNARKMYDVVSRHYARVSQKDHLPYRKNWKVEEHMHEFGDDPNLIDKLNKVMRAEAYHYNHEIKRDQNDDMVYLGLIADRPDRNGETPAKLWAENRFPSIYVPGP